MKRTRSGTPTEVVKTEAAVIKSEAKAVKTEVKVIKTGEKVDTEMRTCSISRSKPSAEPLPLRPTEAEIRLVHAALSHLHPEVIVELQQPKENGCGSRSLVLDALVGTILSQNTTDTNSHRAFSQLKATFKTWDDVRLSAPGLIEDAIRSGGLAQTKTARIQAILNSLHEERGECSLEYLKAESDEFCKEALRRFKGVGAKTISCVLMFCLKRADFPVDTHVWKIAMALGWVSKAATRDQTYDLLNVRVPDDIKYATHVLLVKHGKVYKNDVRVLRETMRALQVAADHMEPDHMEPDHTEPVMVKVKSED